MRKNIHGQGNDAFACEHCGASIPSLTNGSYRNHCPQCLHSKHVDIVPGDRRETCAGLMEPVDLEYSGSKGWMITHECLACGFVRRNTAAPDDIGALIQLCLG